MRRFQLVVLLMTLLGSASAAHALRLHWASGADTLTFTSPTRCVLLLESDSTEALPAEWRLIWLADSLGITFVETDSMEACDVDTARVSRIDPPATPADSAAHVITAQFCSEPGPASLRASFVLDQPGGTSGRLKVVALDPTDSNQERVLESNEVTFNGGVLGEYAPVLLRAESSHQTAELRVTVIGWGLDSVTTMKIGAPDDLWSLPLAIEEQDSIRITSTADVYTLLSDATVQAVNRAGASDLAWLPAELSNYASMATADTDTVLFADPGVDEGWYPKDFAFLYDTAYDPTDSAHPWKAYFHLFYIRAKHNVEGSDSALAHAWSSDLINWQVNLHAFAPRHDGGWEDRAVWAPNIHRVGDLYYMFYTGVDAVANQRIGRATAPSLWTPDSLWTRFESPIYTSFNTGWADQEGHERLGKLSFRDPFVMPDPAPEYVGRFLLFNAGEDKNLFPRYTIGVARNQPSTLAEWTDLGNYEATDGNNLSVTGALESPMVVRDSLTGAWRMFVANADYDDDGFFSTAFLTQNEGDSLTDTRSSSWPTSDWLYDYLDDDADVIGWQACEHLQIGQIHFFAAFEGNGIGITRMHWDADSGKFVIAYPRLTSVDDRTPRRGVRLSLAELRLGSGRVRFLIDSDQSFSPLLALYDVMGRRVRRLTDGRAMQGRKEIEWDGRNESGQPVASGIYFARLTGGGAPQVVRVPMLH